MSNTGKLLKKQTKRKTSLGPDSPENNLNMSVIDSPSIPDFLKTHPDLMKKFKSTLTGRDFVLLDKDSNHQILTYDSQPHKFVEKKLLIIIDHDSNKQTWLKAKLDKWQTLIDSLHKKLVCSIFSETDFSKTYIFADEAELKFLLSELAKFLDQSPNDIQISPHVMEFLKINKNYSDLKLMQIENGIWIQSIEEPRLTKLKEEVGKVISKCYLLDINQYELLRSRQEEILTPIEESLQIKGNAFAADVELVVEVDPHTSISCIVGDQCVYYPVDNMIIWDNLTPSEDFSPVFDRHYYKVWNLFPWNSHVNKVVYAEIQPNYKEDRMKGVIEDCLREIYLNPLPVSVLGIKPCFQSALNWKEFFSCLVSTVKYLQDEQVKIPPHYIMIIAENGEILARIKKVFGNKKSSTEVGQSELNVTVIEGDLTEQKVDIIVNSTNILLKLDQGATSKALLQKAGPELSRECKRNYPKGIKELTCALTKGYNLPCQYVLHGVLPGAYEAKAISTLVATILEHAAKYKASSIAFPVLGTGQLRYPPEEVVNEMNEAFRIFSQKCPDHTIEEVRIVVFPGQPKLKKVMSQIMTSASVDIPPSPPATSEEKWLDNCKCKLLLWILFVNYSCEPENMESLFSGFHRDLEKVPFQIESEDLENLIFFTDIFSLIPDIITQYPKKKTGKIQLHVFRQNLKLLKDSLTDIMSKLTHESLKVAVKLTDKQFKILLHKMLQKYPFVRLQVTDNGKTYHFHSLDWDMNQEAKYLFETFLGLRKNNSFTKYQRNSKSIGKPESPPIPGQAIRPELMTDPPLIPGQAIRPELMTDPPHIPVQAIRPEFMTDPLRIPGQAIRPELMTDLARISGQGIRPDLMTYPPRIPGQAIRPELMTYPPRIPGRGIRPELMTYPPHIPGRGIRPELMTYPPRIPGQGIRPELMTYPPRIPGQGIRPELMTDPPRTPGQAIRPELMTTTPPLLGPELIGPEPKTSPLSEDISCFQMEAGILVKVFQVDILNIGSIAEAIVNVWSPGVSSAIMKAAGYAVEKEMKDKFNSKELNDRQEAITTSAGDLKQFKNIIHAVEPMYQFKNPYECEMNIAEVVYNSLTKASQNGLHSVALPARISTSLEVPLEICTKAYAKGVEEFCKRKPKKCQLNEIYFVDLDPNTCKAIRDCFASNSIQPPNDKSSGIPTERVAEDMEVNSIEYVNVIKCFACQGTFAELMTEKKCKHTFCSRCIEKPCTLCQTQRDIIRGSHPGGVMQISGISHPTNGNCYQMDFSIPISLPESGMINGTTKVAYLPATEEGETILRMLQVAFEHYLLFTVNLGKDVSWSDIPLITRVEDCLNPALLNKIKAWLAAKGISPEKIVKEGELRRWIKIK